MGSWMVTQPTSPTTWGWGFLLMPFDCLMCRRKFCFSLWLAVAAGRGGEGRGGEGRGGEEGVAFMCKGTCTCNTCTTQCACMQSLKVGLFMINV